MSETFKECMKRLFCSNAPDKYWESINRLDMFKVLFDDQSEKITQLTKALEKSANAIEETQVAVAIYLCSDEGIDILKGSDSIRNANIVLKELKTLLEINKDKT